MKTTLTPPTARPQRIAIAIVGAGFAGLACATLLAHAGHQVTVFEKFGVCARAGWVGNWRFDAVCAGILQRLMQRITHKITIYFVAAPAIFYLASSLFGIKLPQKDERPHIAAFPFGASFSLLAFRAHIPIDKYI